MRPLALGLWLLPAATAAQVRIEAVEAFSGTVLGRVCLDLDGDGLCREGEPGVAGARLLLEGGQVAVTDAVGRFHFLEVPARLVAPGRSAYGGHALALEGAAGLPGVSRRFDLSPGGAARVDLAVPRASAVRPGPPVERADRAGAEAPQYQGDRLGWTLSGRAPAASRVEVEGRPARVEGDGSWFARVDLAPGANGFSLALWEADGRLSLYRQVVHLARRREGGDLVVPLPPEWLATVALPADGVLRGHEVRVAGVVAPGVEVEVAGSRVAPGSSGAFEIRATLPAGEGPLPLTARRGETSAQAAPRLRFERGGGAVVGLADLELSLGSGGARLAGRGAIAARGALGPFEGEAGIDLDDRDRSAPALLHPRDGRALERQLSPERSFPTAGDDAASGDANAARGRLHASVRAPGARLDLGAVRSGMTGRELGRYDRALFGAKVAGTAEVGPVRLEGVAFGSSARADPGQAGVPLPAHDVLEASGGSLYYLRHAEVVAGSEALRVEWRDRLTGRPVAQRTLVRTVDYQIDYPGGRVLLATPLAGTLGPPALATGDPLSAPRAVLEADYLHASAAPADDVAGARVALGMGPVGLEAAVASEDRGGSSYRLAAGAASLELGAPLRLRAEAAHSRGTAFAGADGFSASADGGLAFRSPPAPGAAATAWQAEAEGGLAGARYRGWWRERPRGFSDGAHLEAQDARERGAWAAWAGGPAGLEALWAERRGGDPRDPAGLAFLAARDARGRGGWRLGDVRLGAEVLSSRADTASQSGSQLGAGLRADWTARPGLLLHAAWHQSLLRRGDGPAAHDATYAGTGASLEVPGGSVGAEAGWGPALGPRLRVTGEQRSPDGTTYGTFSFDPDAPAFARESAAALGVRRAQGGAEVFSEEQFARDPFGLRASRVSGLSLEPLPGLRLSGRAESGSRLRLDGTTAARWAAGAGAAWLAPRLRLSGRGEVRQDGDRHQALAGAAAEWRAAERLRLAARGTWARSTLAGVPGLALEASLGAAWRGDRLQLLAKVAALAEQRPGEVRRDVALASLAGTLDLTSRLALGAGASYGASRLAGARVDLVAGSARGLVRLGGPFDAAAEYARRAAVRGARPDRVEAGRLEAGWAFAQGRLALGYNLFGFSGSGVDPGEDRGRAYLRAEVSY